MNEKSKHRRSVLVDVLLWLTAGAVAIGFNHLRAGPFWFDVCIGVFFVGLAVLVAVSPRVRRYMRMQYPGGNQSPNPDVIGKYTVLESELDEIRAACLAKLRQQRPNVALVHWGKPAWDAICVGEHQVHYAIFPATLDDKTLEMSERNASQQSFGFRIDGCLVAVWVGDQWSITPMFLPGTVNDAKEYITTEIERMG